VTITAEKAKEIQMHMIKEEMLLMRRIQQSSVSGGQQQQMVMRMIGQARMNCLVRQKFGVRSDEMQAAIIKYGLKDDEQIKGYLKIVLTQIESERKAEHDACSPSQEVLDGLV